jgi:hypothetical protein
MRSKPIFVEPLGPGQAARDLQWIPETARRNLTNPLKSIVMNSYMRPPIPLLGPVRAELPHHHEVLETGADPSFDKIGARRAAACPRPVNRLTFLDGGRRWIQSANRVGVGALPLDFGFPADTIGLEDRDVARDRRADESFMDHSSVKQKRNARFGAGLPLRSPGGWAAPPPSRTERRPRQLSLNDREWLEDRAPSAVLLGWDTARWTPASVPMPCHSTE